jgi:capsular polysaccharide biosynthesis protein
VKNLEPLDVRLGKADAIMELSARAGITGANGWNSGSIPSTLAQIREALPPMRNEETVVSTAEKLGLNWTPIHQANARGLTPPIFTNGRPACFGGVDAVNAFSPEFKLLTIQNGYVGHFFGAPLIMAADGISIVQDVSSLYGGLYQYYDFDLSATIKEAPFIDGIVIPIADDIRPLNFCHWLVDWIPRLSFLGPLARNPSVFVVTTPLIAEYQRDSLRMCGFDESRVIALEDFRAIRAGELVVPNDLQVIPHPIYKGAPWALAYLRSSVGLASLVEASGDVRRREKIYVSRGDAMRRKIVNDAELATALASYGYRTIELSGMSLADQVASFAYASHVVSLHGAGLSNVAFALPGTKVLEIFPERYGTPAFAVIAASVGCSYATYIADSTVAAATTQSDDVEIDVVNFLEVCGHLI